MNFSKAKKYLLSRLEKELNPLLLYHGVHHTRQVISSAIRIGRNENISDSDMLLLKTAALYHDAGILFTYRGHEAVSIQIAKETLPQFGYDQQSIDTICELIIATQLPQCPTTYLAEILCDADLDYLGGDKDRFLQIAESLFHELKGLGFVKTEEEWDKIQINFLTNHKYFTSYCKRTREPRKQKNIELIRKVSWSD
jgi:predicted metal-dependent HD superfamily phosphohydrolase